MDSDWRRITIDTRYEMDKWERVQNGFEDCFTISLAPQDAGMYSRKHQPGAPEVDLLFSPGGYRLARVLIDHYGGVPCAKPPREETAILVAHATGPSPLD